MNRIEEMAHLRSAFRQMDDTQKLALVARLQDIAISYLEPLKDKIQRPMSDTARKAYIAKGINLEWNLTNTDDAILFCFAASRYPDISRIQQKARRQLALCSRVLSDGHISDAMASRILDGHATLDIDADTGISHRKEQSLRAQHLRGKGDYDCTLGDLIKDLAKNYPFDKPTAVWIHFKTAIDEWADAACERVKVGKKVSYRYWFRDKEKSIGYAQFRDRLRDYKNAMKIN